MNPIEAMIAELLYRTLESSPLTFFSLVINVLLWGKLNEVQNDLKECSESNKRSEALIEDMRRNFSHDK